ncbi:MAG: SPOR domain-containing protein [Halanaerobium sp.]
MKKNESGFSLVIVVIFMSIAALFVGYIMGSWLISLMTEETEQEIANDNAEQVEEFQDISNNSTDEDNQSLESEESSQENVSSEEEVETTGEEDTETADEETTDESQFEGEDLSGTFAVQIGAFNNIDSANSLKEEFEDLGYDAFVTESQPHKIRVGAFETREEAEEAEAELDSRDIEGFIVFRD